MKTVAVLFARSDSVYKTIPGCDVWDIERDARRWPGGAPVVAHPPCRGFGKLRQFSHASQDEIDMVRASVDTVRRFGGVLEHPAESRLWWDKQMPLPGHPPDRFGGWTAEIRQCDFGHKAEKLTWLYIVGAHPDDLPPMPSRGEPTHYIKRNRKDYRPSAQSLPTVTKAEREHTPRALAEWLVELALRCALEARAVA